MSLGFGALAPIEDPHTPAASAFEKRKTIQ
jgi:hypothetical protein